MKYLYAILVFAACITAQAQNLKPVTYSTNGYVYDIANDENNLYIGGGFSQVGITANYFTYFPIGDDKPEFDLLQPNSTVDIAISDGKGGWCIGG